MESKKINCGMRWSGKSSEVEEGESLGRRKTSDRDDK
jgi:hypothetical protein